MHIGAMGGVHQADNRVVNVAVEIHPLDQFGITIGTGE